MESPEVNQPLVSQAAAAPPLSKGRRAAPTNTNQTKPAMAERLAASAATLRASAAGTPSARRAARASRAFFPPSPASSARARVGLRAAPSPLPQPQVRVRIPPLLGYQGGCGCGLVPRIEMVQQQQLLQIGC